ncbi:MAG: hypothetical protein J2P21_18085, partial [Chloracidobacterium sp.]|nr:hypothetical protein [Chloracidobacterium sp.]
QSADLRQSDFNLGNRRDQCARQYCEPISGLTYPNLSDASREAYQPQQEYQRVIAVPFRVRSGKVLVEEPEETTLEVDRSVSLPPGHYRLASAS